MSPERGLRGITGLLRGITSIPRRTLPDVLRGGVTLRIGGGSLLGGVSGVPRRSTAGELDWSNIVERGRKRARPQPRYEEDNRIGWEAEIVENYDNQGNLGIILEFTGIGLTSPFLRGKRYYGPDTTLFYSRISYRNRRALLILATTGDILESQVVPNRKDVNPLFQEELYIPPLATCDPASMAVAVNNGLVIVGYNPRA